MKKIFLTVQLLGACVASASINFSGTSILNSGSGTIWDAGSLAVYVVDTNGDGFSASVNIGDSVAAGSSFGASDDIILFTVGTQGNNSSVAAVGAASFDLPVGASVNDNWAIYIFDNEVSSSTTLQNSGTYGIFTSQEVGASDWDLPADGETWSFAASPTGSQFQQLQGVAGGTFSVVPEPSTFAAIAGMFALTWVMVRRRQA